jgi:UDP-N-acetylmuramoylalanine--D-glutamate ligase
MDYHGLRATVMGLGHFGGGAAAARWLASQGAVVTISDTAGEDRLTDAISTLSDVSIAAYHLGGHREEDFRQADLVVVNPAVRPDSPWLRIARESGAKLRTELELFIENCPARIIGVTGSNGKSTTAAMIAAILKTASLPSPFGRGTEGEGKSLGDNEALTLTLSQRERGQTQLKAVARQVFLGGNIGGSLLDELSLMTPDDWVVLEISSFQLWHFSPNAKMPHIAVVTGCSPNHLDWHPTFADYAAAKQRMLTGQTSEDFAVLNTMDAEVASWSPLVSGQVIGISTEDVPPLSVPGEHNRLDAALAAAAATAAGCSPDDIRRGLDGFRGLPQRLEHFATIEGRDFYNDSTATTPESTIAALRSLDKPIWLLAGGKAKGFDLGPLVAEIARQSRGAAFFGSVRNELLARTTAIDSQFPCTAVETMDAALDWCWRRSQPGEAIILSPACASTDQFRNFRERGRRFAAMVQSLGNPNNR